MTTANTVEAQHVEGSQNGSGSEVHQPLLTVLPLRYAKTIHFIRHGEGFHNVAGRADHEAYKSWEYEDSHLTAYGWQQAHQVRDHIRQAGLSVDLVVTSPLTRALETAVGCFGDPQAPAPASGRAPLMVELTERPGKRAAHPAVSGQGAPPFVVHELCREHLGVHPCDRRRDLSAVSALFPGMDWSGVTSEADELWSPTHRETKDEIMARGRAFMAWLSARPEASIAVVSHSSFLHFTMTNFGLADSTEVQGTLHKWWENCELKSVVLADGGAGARPPTRYDFPGFASHVKEGPELSGA